MQEPTTKQPVADPADYRVSLYRRRDGSLSHIDLWMPADHGTVIHRAEDVDALLARARDLATADPHDDRLPPDRAIIEAALLDAGFALKDEDEPAAQHTPGPWVVCEYTAFVLTADDHTVASVYPGNGDHPDYDHPISMANARLIAAAPDMLAALKSCLAEMAMHGIREDACGFGDMDGGPTLEVLRSARAAIAKAEGR